MSLARSQVQGTWVKSASTTQLNKIGPPKAVPLYNTMVLKEGYLLVRRFKGKAAGTIQSKRQRYCVLWLNNFSASLDMYTDDTKRKIKKRLSLDRSVEAISLSVKGYNKALPKDSSCLQLRIGPDMYEFSTNDGVKEKKSWCAKLRQAINRDVNMLSGEVMGIVHPDDSPCNIQFSCDCIILTCPFKHTFLKTWKLAFVTSFGQSGNTFTFECCSNCCSEEKCVIEADQYTTKCLVSSMEAAMMEFPSRSQVVMEKNILGDIYHCSHVCMRRFLDNRRASAPPRNRRRHREVTTNTMYTYCSQEHETSPPFMDNPLESSLDLSDRYAKDKYLSLIGSQGHTYSSICSEQPLYSTIEDLNKFGSPDFEERSSYSGGDETDQSFGSSTLASSTGESELHLYDQPPNVSIYDIPSDKSKMLWRVQDSYNDKHSYKVYIPDSDVAYDVPRFRARLGTNTSHMLYDTPTASMKKRWNSVGDSLSPEDMQTSFHSKFREAEKLHFNEQVRPFLATQV